MGHSNSSTKTKRHKLLRVFSFVFIGLAVFLFLLPIFIKFAGQYVLEDLGADNAYIKDVDLNLFTGRFALKGVQVTSKQRETISLDQLVFDLSMKDLLKKQILVETLSIDGLDLNIFQQDDTWIVGIPIPDSEATDQEQSSEDSSDLSWTFGVNSIRFENITANLEYEEEAFSLQINELQLSELLMWNPDKRSPFIINGLLNDSAFQFKSQLEPFAKSPHVSLDLKLSDFDLSFLSSFSPADISHLKAKLSIDTAVDIKFEDEQLYIKQSGGFSFNNLQLLNDQLEAGISQLSWHGNADVVMDQQYDASVNLQGKLGAQSVDLALSDILLSTGLQDLVLEASVNLNTADLESSLEVTTDLIVSQWLLKDNNVEATLAVFERLLLEDIQVKGIDDIQLGQFTIEQLQALLTKDQSFASFEQFSISNLLLKQKDDLYIEEVYLQNLSANILLNEHEKIAQIDDWLLPLLDTIQQQYQQNDEEASQQIVDNTDNLVADKVEQQSPFTYRVDKLTVQGNETITFVDKSVTPAVRHHLSLQNISLGKINSHETDYPTPIDATIKLYKHGSFTAQGHIGLLQELEQMSGELHATIEGIELADVSPYIEQAVGYQARSGQFNSDIDVALHSGQLDSKTKVRIQRIDLKPHDKEVMEQASKSIAMPISTALRIITDKNNTLKLTVPVKGDLSHPDVKVNKIMSDAIAQAVKNTALTYFKFAVQPFGAIMMVSQAIGNAKLQARFEDVRFEVGSSDIVAEQKGYLAKVAEMIKEKKDFSVVACVYVTDEDFMARAKPPKLAEDENYQWDEESKELAEERLEYIRSSLIERHGLSSNQIQACKPQLGKGQARAVLGI